MGTEQFPPYFGSVERSAREARDARDEGAAQWAQFSAESGKSSNAESRTAKPWVRAASVVSLAAGAALIARGNRRAGLVATAAGVIVLLLEHPEDVSAVWGSIPRFIQASRRVLDRTEGIVQDLTDQAETVRGFLDRATAQHS